MIFRETFGHFAELMTGDYVHSYLIFKSNLVFQIPSAITFARSCWNIPLTSSETSFANLLHRILLIFHSTCMELEQFKR